MDKLSEYREKFRKTYQLGKYLMIATFFMLCLLSFILSNLINWKIV